MARKPKKLTTTSFILLGQLMARPWSAYDLTKHLQRSLTREVWPRAESHIYDEVKNLAAHGLATVSEETNGGRSRAVYTIVDKGRDAFLDWLTEPGGDLLLEWEKVVKIAFGDYLGKEDLMKQIARLRDELVDKTVYWHDLLGTAESPEAFAFPHRAHMGGLLGDLLLRIHEAIFDWSDWAEAEAASWPDAKMSPEARTGYLRVLERNLAVQKARLAQYGRSVD